MAPSLIALLVLTLALLALGWMWHWEHRRRQEAERRFQALMELAPLPILVTAIQDGSVQALNPTARTFYGLDPQEDLRSLNTQAFYADPEARNQVVKALQQQGRLEAFPVRVRTRQGEIRSIVAFSRVIPTKGRPHILTLHLDNRELDRTRQELEQALRLQAAILENSPIGVALIRNRVFAWANPRMAAITAMPLSELIGTQTRRFYLDDASYTDLAERATRALQTRQVFQDEIQVCRADGTPFWCHVSGQYLDGTHPEQGTVWMFEDITEHHHTEQALKQSEEMLSRIFQLSPEAIAITTLEHGRYVQVNDAVCRQLGYPREALLGQTSEDLGVWVHPEQRTRMVTSLLKSHEVTNLEVQMRTRHQQVLSVLLSARLLKLADQTCIITLARDITEQRRAEEALRQAQKAESLTLMAGGIAHDFNNLFQSILGNLELLRLLPDDPGQSRTLLERAASALHQANTLSRSLLDFTGSSNRQSRAVSLSECLAQARERLEQQGFDLQRLSLNGGTLIPVEGDPDQISKVLASLLANALEATVSQGRVQVFPGLPEDSRADLHWLLPAPAGARSCLTIEDSGIGMDGETLSRAFDPFFSTKASGRGLGLPSALGILRAHGAGLGITSSKNQGTRIVLCFLAASVNPAAEVSAPTAPPRGRAVLLVDDEPMVRQVTRMALQQLFKLEVLEARDGVEALELMRTQGEQVGLILMDAVMPRMGGVEAFGILRQEFPHIPGILCSGYSEDLGQRTAREHGFRAFLGKPYTWDQLKERLIETELL